MAGPGARLQDQRDLLLRTRRQTRQAESALGSRHYAEILQREAATMANQTSPHDIVMLVHMLCSPITNIRSYAKKTCIQALQF